ncbi:hypothetical protein [Desulfobacter sp.]|uniref:hypothetical protein n=1 Tax=Desulfobacter sp. TaxID=2294 RepID=UPI000E969ECF|nr:hypothetical protein [Desulfobacter sp.]HBT86969.1 hypothetical protein [Desulfobacter sp.]
MPVFRDCKPCITSGLLNLQSVKQMLFCIAQDESAAQELDAYTLLGISNILDSTGHEIEAAYDELLDKQEAMVKRHRKLRAKLAAYLESGIILGKSDLAMILADDEQEVGL